MKLSVIVPTYRRPDALKKCLVALENQDQPPHEVIVVRRDSDEQTQQVLRNWLHQTSAILKKVAVVKTPGVVAAMEAGVSIASGDVVALTDDDAVPRRDWLARLTLHYADPQVGGAGGRDVVHSADVPKPGKEVIVGRVQWWGRVIGNHHLGVGAPRNVDVLKGVNFSLRKDLWSFPTKLRGSGAQVFWELDVCLRLRRLGWKLVYDPSAVVDHFPAERFDEDQRGVPEPAAVRNVAHNEVIALLRNLPTARMLVFLVYTLLVGTRAHPGLFLLPFASRNYGRRWPRYGAASLAGKASGCFTYIAEVRPGASQTMRGPRSNLAGRERGT